MRTNETATTGRDVETIAEFVFGDSRYHNPYKTEDIEIYAKELARMNLIDLQNEAIAKNIKPSGGRSAIIAKLKKEFTKKNRQISLKHRKPSNARDPEKVKEVERLAPKF